MEKEIIKENSIRFNGGFLPFADIFYGNMKLTKEKLIIEYYLLGLTFPGVNKVYGVGKKKIEIPIQNIKDISIAQHKFSGMLKITYGNELKTKKIYLSPWFYFETMRSMELIKICGEWVEEVNKLRNTNIKS